MSGMEVAMKQLRYTYKCVSCRSEIIEIIDEDRTPLETLECPECKEKMVWRIDGKPILVEALE